MAGEMTFKLLNAAHRWTLKMSGGRFGWKLRGMQVVELTTTGRRSGQKRTVMLTSPLTYGDALVVVASKGGDDRHPGWYLNLVADSNVWVAVKGQEAISMVARTATEDERDLLWPRITDTYKPYGAYQQKSVRSIPVVLLAAR